MSTKDFHESFERQKFEVFTIPADAEVKTLVLRVKSILIVALTTSPDERRALLRRHLKAPLVQEVLARTGLA